MQALWPVAFVLCGGTWLHVLLLLCFGWGVVHDCTLAASAFMAACAGFVVSLRRAGLAVLRALCYVCMMCAMQCVCSFLVLWHGMLVCMYSQSA